MEAINDGGPVFPHLHTTCQRVNESEMFPGMSLRAYLAGRAMQGFLANSFLMESLVASRRNDEKVKAMIAKDSVAYADALLVELAKEPTNE